ncbi:MAG: type II toxin-antitoxin system RatA family toxin [Vulcanimicrobiaceae bacterium]
MTTMTNSVRIAAPARRIYDLASATERWPEILPHYRFVRVLSQNGDEREVEMAARRGLIPVRWTAVQRNDEQTPAVYFRHTSGWTKGMDVVWRFEENANATDVSIVHDLTFSFPVAEKAIEKYVVTGYFIDGIARRTLACMKALAEAQNGG